MKTWAWPKGNMIEGRSGGSGRGTRRESWALPDSGSAHPTDRRFVSCTRLSTRSRSLRRPRISFPPPLPHPRICLLAPGKNSAAPKRTFRSALVSADGGPKGKMIEGRSGGSWRGTRRELWAPPDSGSAQPTDRRFVSYTTLDRAVHCAALAFLPSAASSPSHLPAGHREKFRRTRAHVQLGTRLRRMAGPKGK